LGLSGIPLLFVVVSLWMLIWTFVLRPHESILGLVTILCGAIFYRWRLRGSVGRLAGETVSRAVKKHASEKTAAARRCSRGAPSYEYGALARRRFSRLHVSSPRGLCFSPANRPTEPRSRQR